MFGYVDTSHYIFMLILLVQCMVWFKACLLYIVICAAVHIMCAHVPSVLHVCGCLLYTFTTQAILLGSVYQSVVKLSSGISWAGYGANASL